MILDEIHRVPKLFQTLRGLIDQGRRKGKRTGRFLVLGFAAIDLLHQSGESLAGRIEYVDLGPLNVLEIVDKDKDVQRLWLRGGFPDSYWGTWRICVPIFIRIRERSWQHWWLWHWKPEVATRWNGRLGYGKHDG